jgi:hypothetical protein
MKALVLAFFVSGAALAAADVPGNVLQNGDFANGLTHWDGDCRTLSVATNEVAPGNGAAIELLAGWAKMTQVFEVQRGRYVFNIVYSLGPGTTFSPEEKEYRKIPAKLGFDALKEFRAKRGEWVVIVTDLKAKRYVHCEVKPLKNDPGEQTLTGELHLDTGDNNTFCLAFPPGNGLITITSISLVRKD